MTEEEYNAEERRLVEVNAKSFPEFKHANNKSYAEARASWSISEKDLVWRESASAAINLVVNALCYLAYDGREVVLRYPADTPDNLVRLTQDASRKVADRAHSKLATAGFRKVHICGESLRPKGVAAHGGDTKAAHWRRGHWRNQAHGRGWQQRKLVWIMPVLVGHDEAPSAGHLYVVGQ
jgi:hypothetical protein